ncbi:MAG: hypothetical protein U9Q99_01555 [Nanoarchaeota archaeon]|nr:hypothetical protein [Nanoarchaeota archaeon]
MINLNTLKYNSELSNLNNFYNKHNMEISKISYNSGSAYLLNGGETERNNAMKAISSFPFKIKQNEKIVEAKDEDREKILNNLNMEKILSVSDLPNSQKNWHCIPWALNQVGLEKYISRTEIGKMRLLLTKDGLPDILPLEKPQIGALAVYFRFESDRPSIEHMGVVNNSQDPITIIQKLGGKGIYTTTMGLNMSHYGNAVAFFKPVI